MVEGGGGSGVVVVRFTVAITTCYRTIYAIVIRTFAATAIAVATVAHRGSDVVAVTIEVAIVVVVVVVIPVDGSGTVRTMGTVRAWIVRIPGVVGIRTIPTPTVVETAVVPEGIVVVGTIVVARPPPVVTHVDA